MKYHIIERKESHFIFDDKEKAKEKVLDIKEKTHPEPFAELEGPDETDKWWDINRHELELKDMVECCIQDLLDGHEVEFHIEDDSIEYQIRDIADAIKMEEHLRKCEGAEAEITWKLAAYDDPILLKRIKITKRLNRSPYVWIDSHREQAILGWEKDIAKWFTNAWTEEGK